MIYRLMHSFFSRCLRRSGYTLVRTYRMPVFGLDILRILILCLFQKERDNFYFVQIGANDGVGDDPVASSVRHLGLKGLFVEPLPSAFSQLQKNYADIGGLAFENAAIGNVDGAIELFVPEGADRNSRLSQKASMSAAVVKNHVGVGRLEKLSVPSITMSTLLDKHQIRHISLLVVDTEGFDFEIVKQLLSETELRPSIVQYELVHLSRAEREAGRRLLEECGYRFQENWKDMIAVRKDEPDWLQ